MFKPLRVSARKVTIALTFVVFLFSISSVNAQNPRSDTAVCAVAANFTFAQTCTDQNGDPWKLLQYRQIGPFRGGRVAAVAGVRVSRMFIISARRAAAFGKQPMPGSIGFRFRTIFSKPVRSARLRLPILIRILFMSEWANRPSAAMFRTATAFINRWTAARPGNISAWRFAADRRIRVHPKNPDIVYVAAMGHLWGEQ